MLLKKILVLLFLVVILLLEVIVRGGSISPIFFQVLLNRNIELSEVDKNDKSNRINILLLGIGGGNHEGPRLTDSIIVASIDVDNSKINLISLPRDMWSFELEDRINSAYAKGEEKKEGGGLVLAKSVISEIIGQPINYGVVIDFNGFIKAIDIVGGLDIDVDRTFDDYQYPITGNENELCGHSEEEIETFTATNSAETALVEFFPCRYEHLHFDQGVQYMDGETALKFVRSRHAIGSEGTDFARSKRQEKIINAFMSKIFSLNFIANPNKILNLYGTLQESIDTDIQESEFDDFIKLAQKFRNSEIDSVVIDYGDKNERRGGLLTNPPISEKYKFKWTLVPRIGDDNFSEIHEYVKCRLERDVCIVSELP
jgi:polyisoprenyl-teichoic acid--peptidoglycan teichoic acid transferase